MTFALVQISPFSVVTTFTALPEPVIWPDGAATHGVTVGAAHGPWLLAQMTATPPSPGEFYSIANSVPSLSGTTVVYTQTWAPLPLTNVLPILFSRIDGAAESARSTFLMGIENVNSFQVGQSLTFLEKRAELLAIAAATVVVPANYPLLTAMASVLGTSLASTAQIVAANFSAWTAQAASIEATRLNARAAVNNATTVAAAVAAWTAVIWPVG